MKKKLFGLLAVVLLITLAVLGYFVFGHYSEGYRAGQVMKFSKKGVLFKTWEGQLDIGGLQGGGEADGAATTVWEFSVRDKDVVKQIERAVDNGSKVKLFYKEKFYKLSFLGDTPYFVYNVEEIGKGLKGAPGNGASIQDKVAVPAGAN